MPSGSSWHVQKTHFTLKDPPPITRFVTDLYMTTQTLNLPKGSIQVHTNTKSIIGLNTFKTRQSWMAAPRNFDPDTLILKSIQVISWLG